MRLVRYRKSYHLKAIASTTNGLVGVFIEVAFVDRTACKLPVTTVFGARFCSGFEYTVAVRNSGFMRVY